VGFGGAENRSSGSPRKLLAATGEWGRAAKTNPETGSGPKRARTKENYSYKNLERQKIRHASCSASEKPKK
jgi:hypothetical protein